MIDLLKLRISVCTYTYFGYKGSLFIHPSFLSYTVSHCCDCMTKCNLGVKDRKICKHSVTIDTIQGHIVIMFTL